MDTDHNAADTPRITLKPGQRCAMRMLEEFVGGGHGSVFILKGYAGTGKTTLVRELIKVLVRRRVLFKLLASTGRAAKIMANITSWPASTVHSEVYDYAGFNQDVDEVMRRREASPEVDNTGQLLLNFLVGCCDTDREVTPHFYIVDESSMISDEQVRLNTQAQFGSGRLLSDLFAYDPIGRFVFVGDECQLPPITQPFSPALSAAYISSRFQKGVTEAVLTEVVRQKEGNDIALAAHKMRQLYHKPQPWAWAKFPLRGYRNIQLLRSSAELISLYLQDIKANGFNHATMITHSNRSCNSYAQLLRPALGITSPHLSAGDLLLITQNNMCGLMNGDMVQVEKVGVSVLRANLTFVHVEVKELFSGKLYNRLLIADLLYDNETNITGNQQKELYIDFFFRMKDKGIKKNSPEFERALREDEFLNALRGAFGYCLTCHKSQGGEWDNVYLDIPRYLSKMPKPGVYQWVYTAMTRAKKTLYLVDDFYLI